MWYVIKAEKGAGLYSGFSGANRRRGIRETGGEQYDHGCASTLRRKMKVMYFSCRRDVHAIGAGCFIAEIQQTSNITYRIYDYNRKDANGNGRELHTELAKDAHRLYVVSGLPYSLQRSYECHGRVGGL